METINNYKNEEKKKAYTTFHFYFTVYSFLTRLSHNQASKFGLVLQFL